MITRYAWYLHETFKKAWVCVVSFAILCEPGADRLQLGSRPRRWPLREL